MRQIDFYPNPKQKIFLRSDKKYVCYGGARGGGKSFVVRLDAVRRSITNKGHKALIVRLSYPELQGNHILPLQQMLNGIARFNKSEKRFYFPNGSFIKLDYCGSDKDVLHYQGQEYDAIYIDEATNLKWGWIEKIMACNRGDNSFRHQVFFTANPGGVSHAEFKRIFVDRRFKNEEDPDEYEFIQAKVTDNKALMESDPTYIKILRNLPPKLRTAWLDGDWNIFEGVVFEQLRVQPDIRQAIEHGYDGDPDQLLKERRWTHVIKPFQIPRRWPIYRSFDWGYRRPFSMGYWTVDQDQVIYRIDQFYGVQRSNGESIPNEGLKWSPDRVFSEIQSYERQKFPGRQIIGVADPALWKAESGQSFAETACKYGIFFNKGDNERITGLMQCHYRLQFSPEGFPRMYIFDTCKDFIRTLPLLQYDEHKVQDVATQGQDHQYDEFRYFAMTRKIKPMVQEQVSVPAWGADPLDQYSWRRKR